MVKSKKRVVNRKKRAFRVRKRVFGSADSPRLCVRRSLKHIYAQLVDDSTGTSIVQVSSAGKEVAEKIKEISSPAKKSDVARIVGELLAGIAQEKGIKRVVFDRKGYPYHGRIKVLADAARSKGLVF